MQDSEQITELLREIRDVHNEHLREYRKVTQRSLELQERAVDRQEQLSKTYRFALIVSGVLIVGIVLLIVYLMTYLPTRYR